MPPNSASQPGAPTLAPGPHTLTLPGDAEDASLSSTPHSCLAVARAVHNPASPRTPALEPRLYRSSRVGSQTSASHLTLAAASSHTHSNWSPAGGASVTTSHPRSPPAPINAPLSARSLASTPLQPILPPPCRERRSCGALMSNYPDVLQSRPTLSANKIHERQMLFIEIAPEEN